MGCPRRNQSLEQAERTTRDDQLVARQRRLVAGAPGVEAPQVDDARERCTPVPAGLLDQRTDTALRLAKVLDALGAHDIALEHNLAFGPRLVEGTGDRIPQALPVTEDEPEPAGALTDEGALRGARQGLGGNLRGWPLHPRKLVYPVEMGGLIGCELPGSQGAYGQPLERGGNRSVGPETRDVDDDRAVGGLWPAAGRVRPQAAGAGLEDPEPGQGDGQIQLAVV